MGLALWLIGAAGLFAGGDPRQLALRAIDMVASRGHGALSVADSVRLAVAVALAFAVLVALITAVLRHPRPLRAALVAVGVVLLTGTGLWVTQGRHGSVNFTSAAVLGVLIGWLVAAGLSSLRARRLVPRGVRVIAALLLVAFFAAAAFVGFWHEPVDRGSRGGLRVGLAILQGFGAPTWLDYGGVEFAANIVFFMPLGLLLTLVLPPRRWWLAVAVGCISSACIEIGQAVFLPARSASVDDFVANSGGALLGALVAASATARWGARRGPGQIG